ncbi:spore-associated protein A [Nocardiopsis protaetiae]|uniref:spore-associated protein A n=1 Tax=Nocardiopsis protaetiae TaxID=3382270 RepID=UPI00387B3241
MLKRFRSAALIAAVAATASIGLASPASAAAPFAPYNGACGSGYSVVNHADVALKGTVFITYNASNGYNCAIAIRRGGSGRIPISVGIKRTNDGDDKYVQEGGQFLSYAGPVYLRAAGQCIDWYGFIDGRRIHRTGTNCG